MIKRIGIDLGGHTISGGEVDFSGGAPRLVSPVTVRTPSERDPLSVLRAVEELALMWVSRGDECFIGIGVPGFVSKDRLAVLKLTNFKGCEGARVGTLIARDMRARGISAEVRLENDANCAAVGEHICGAARGMDDFAVLTLGSGIGAGLAANGRLIRGAHGMAGECGHMALCGEGFRGCFCGGAGHLEEAASADWVERRALERGLPGDFRVLWGMREKNGDARALIEASLDALARDIASICAALDPEAVILNGGMSRAEGMADELRGRATKYLPSPMRAVFRLLLSELGSSAAVMGAAALDGGM